MHTILSRRPQSGGGKAKPAAADQASCGTRQDVLDCVSGQMAKKLKIKTHRGAAKRFKRTKNGKFLRGAAFKQHILTSKTQQAEARAARHDDGRRRRRAEARADAAVQIDLEFRIWNQEFGILITIPNSSFRILNAVVRSKRCRV